MYLGLRCHLAVQYDDFYLHYLFLIDYCILLNTIFLNVRNQRLTGIFETYLIDSVESHVTVELA